MKEFIFIWRIENISYSWRKTGECINSPIFYAGPMKNTAWTLSLYPRGRDDCDFLSLFLHREIDEFPRNIAVNFELSIISADASVLNSSFTPEALKTFMKNDISGFGESCFIKRYEVFERRKALYLPQDTLTFRCRMWKNEGNDDDSGQIVGLTRLTTEKIISVGNINPEREVVKTIVIESKNQNMELLSITFLYFDDGIEVEINPSGRGKIKFSTFKFAFSDKKTENKLCEILSSFYGIPKKEKWRLLFTDKMLPTENVNSEARDFEFKIEFVYSTGEEIKTLEKSCPLKNNLLTKNSAFLSNYINRCVPSGKTTDCSTISDDIWNLYSKQVLCDVELKTEIKSFFAHKFVLCARSSVFLSMLTGDMKEKMNACINIEDISDDTLEKFLFFLYTDVFKDLEWNAAVDLYYVADKYQVERLKLLCGSYLLEKLDVCKVCELLILADRHYDGDLKQKVDDFIWKNEERVFRSSMWKKFANEQKALAMQTMLSKYEEKGNHNPTETYEDKLFSVPRIRDEFRSLLDGHNISDVVIKTDSVAFPAHKAVLGASSGTFMKLLINDFGNKSTDFIEMTHWDNDTVSRMLLFLYTDSMVDIQWNTVVKLYELANVYQIRRLQIKCSCFLLENIKESNASNLLLLAHECNDVKFKSAVEDFILMHDEEIFGSNEWAKFSRTNFLLANETMLAKYKKN